MAVSIKDIARAAGVKSHTTVSRALADRPGVGGETRARILRVADDLGYRPSVAARSLKTRRSGMIGVVITSLRDPFFADVVEGIERAGRDAGYAVVLTMAHEDERRERLAVESLVEHRVDGVIVAASRLGSRYVPLLRTLQVPVVLVNAHELGPYVHGVGIDEAHGTQTTTGHLLALGHRRLAYLGNRAGGPTNARRRQGFEAALEGAGIPVDPALMVEGGFGVEEGTRMADELLASAAPPTGLVAYSDLTAIGALKSAIGRGLHVPRDISVVGFDGLDVAQWVTPSLTTYAQPRRDLGRHALELAVGVLAGEPAPPRLVLLGALVEGGSTAPPAAGRDSGTTTTGRNAR